MGLCRRCLKSKSGTKEGVLKGETCDRCGYVGGDNYQAHELDMAIEEEHREIARQADKDRKLTPRCKFAAKALSGVYRKRYTCLKTEQLCSGRANDQDACPYWN